MNEYFLPFLRVGSQNIPPIQNYSLTKCMHANLQAKTKANVTKLPVTLKQ